MSRTTRNLPNIVAAAGVVAFSALLVSYRGAAPPPSTGGAGVPPAVPSSQSLKSGAGVPSGHPLRGDANCDGRVDFADINPFAVLLADPQRWSDSTGCPREAAVCLGDFNGDGRVDLQDINGLVARLASGAGR